MKFVPLQLYLVYDRMWYGCRGNCCTYHGVLCDPGEMRETQGKVTVFWKSGYTGVEKLSASVESITLIKWLKFIKKMF